MKYFDLKKHIYLIGFMGSGKSTIGKALAFELKLPFLDFDDFLEAKEKTSISEIFETKGEDYFRALESKSLSELKMLKDTTISLGGGTPCYHNNMRIIEETGISIYLKCNVKTLSNRLFGEKDKRPLLRSFNNLNALESYVIRKLDDRNSFYKNADIIINGNEEPDTILENILKKLSSNQSTNRFTRID